MTVKSSHTDNYSSTARQAQGLTESPMVDRLAVEVAAGQFNTELSGHPGAGSRERYTLEVRDGLIKALPDSNKQFPAVSDNKNSSLSPEEENAHHDHRWQAVQRASNVPHDTASRCRTGAIFTECQGEGEHGFGKDLLCGVDWCPECGQIGSVAHNRRIAKWLPKFQQIDVLGYGVIEFPDRLRHKNNWVYSKAGISRVNRIVKDVLAGKRGKGNKRAGGWFPGGGLAKWHWYGDRCVNAQYRGDQPTLCRLNGGVCPKNHKDCENFVNDGKLNQHINFVTINGGFVDKKALKAALIQEFANNGLDCPDLIFHYNYYKLPAQKYQKLAYITRPTFKKREWDNHFASVIYNFRSSFWWGRTKVVKTQEGKKTIAKSVWVDETKEALPTRWEVTKEMQAEGFAEANTIGSGTCPDCGAALNKWSGMISAKLLHEVWKAEEIGKTGYYRIPSRGHDPDGMTPERVRKLQQINWTERGRYVERANIDALKCFHAAFNHLHSRYVHKCIKWREYAQGVYDLTRQYAVEVDYNWHMDTNTG